MAASRKRTGNRNVPISSNEGKLSSTTVKDFFFFLLLFYIYAVSYDIKKNMKKGKEKGAFHLSTLGA